MTLQNLSIKNIVTRVIKGEDYRIEIVNIINAEFLQFAVEFFKEVAKAKLDSKDITLDWYKAAFMNESLSSDDIAVNAGINKKTVYNMYRSATRQVVINTANEHFDLLLKTIESLVEIEKEIDLTLTIKFKGVSVDLNVSESLIVINALAVKRAALRGGLWSTAGKSAEKYIMLALCKLYKVPSKNYDARAFVKDKTLDVDREVDFYLVNGERRFRCEVKLMGQGNPESADMIIARNTDLFVADTLSAQNKAQCNKLGVCWVALRDEGGFRRFALALKRFGIPNEEYTGNTKEDVARVVDEIL